MEKLIINNSKETLAIPFTSIMYLIAEGRYTSIFTITEKKMLFCKNIGKFEDLLPSPPFIRSHHSCLINVKKITKLNDSHAILENGDIVPISKRKFRQVKKMIYELGKQKISQV